MKKSNSDFHDKQTMSSQPYTAALKAIAAYLNQNKTKTEPKNSKFANTTNQPTSQPDSQPFNVMFMLDIRLGLLLYCCLSLCRVCLFVHNNT